MRRLCQMLITLFGVSFLTFSLTYLSPGDPAETLLEVGDSVVSQETIDATRKELGLDQPFLVQYGRWLGGVLHGDMGRSYSAKIPVFDKLMQCLPGTLALAVAATAMTVLISLPLGIVAALYRNRWIDYVIRVLSFFGVSMPGFWIGLVLLYIFGLKLHLFPIAGGDITARGIVLPALTLAVVMSAKYTRQVRTAVLEELGQDYVIGAKARGLCLPLVTLLGLAIGWLLGGVAVIEMVFSWPGLGKMAVHAIEMRDYPLVQGFVLWIAILYMLINLLVDISYAKLDPRLKRGGR